MKFQTVVLLLAAVQAAAASPCKAACQPNECLNGLLGSESGSLDDCSANLLVATTVAGAETTTTAIPQITITESIPDKRDAALNIPSYASACSNEAQYISACSCVGFTSVTTEAPLSTTESTTETSTTTTTTSAFSTYTVQVVANYNYPGSGSSDNIYAAAVNAPIMFYSMSLQPSEDAALEFELSGEDWSLKAITSPPGRSIAGSYATYNTAGLQSQVGLIPGSYLQVTNSPRGVFRLDAPTI
ncbi:hypothetical protein QQZ08_001787 [Neonectria magnoliae]|uniref:Uncharacterized protein n=1 Tax=Neonectria magnoliae TaxID=2732573 RepID=A0ABR1IEZ5_9HYPO